MAYNDQDTDPTRSAYKQASDMGKSFAQTASEQSDRARANLEGAADQLSERGREAAENAQAVVGNFKTAVERSTRDHPMTTLAMAAAMGFLLGAIWK